VSAFVPHSATAVQKGDVVGLAPDWGGGRKGDADGGIEE
jgi:hypothetical protein